MWKEAKSRGRRWQWKYQNQGSCEAHCDCKRKERISKIDLFCLFFKDVLSIFVALSQAGLWSRIREVTCQPCTLFQSVFNDLVRRAVLIGGLWKWYMQELGWSIWLEGTCVLFPRSAASSCRSVSLSYVLRLDVAFIKYFPSAPH